MTTILKLSLRFVVFLSSRHRSIGIRDWLAALLGTFGLVAGIVGIAVWHLTSSSMGGDAWIAFVLTILLVIYVALLPLLFILKLRRIGITDADFAVTGGIDYKAALRSGRGGFSFMGVGGAKLTQMNDDFRAAVQSARKTQQPIRMLLVDPQSSSIATLEHRDGGQAYATEIGNSIRLITDLAHPGDDVLNLKTYMPEAVADFKPFRLFFAGEDCLVSPFVPGTGVIDRGRQLPQIRVTSAGWPRKDSPTLYVAFERLFEENWSDTTNSVLRGNR